MLTDFITINEHSSICMKGDKIIYFDPFHILTEPHDADIIFFTHEHYDHYSPIDYLKLSNENTILVAPESMHLENAISLKPGDILDIQGIQVEAVRAYNMFRTQFHPIESNWLGYVIAFNGYRIYVCGDTEATDEAKAVNCDILLCPIGGKYTMDPREAANLANCIRPKVAIPTHYGSIVGNLDDAELFKTLINPFIPVETKIYMTKR